MSTLIVTDNEFATVRYYTESGIIHHEWKKYCHGKVFREIMLAATRCLKENKGTKWLSDDRNYQSLTEEDSIWGQKIWFMETIAAGWKHWAIIFPERQMGKISLSVMFSEYRAAGINAQAFDSVAEAMTWLEAQ